MKRGPWLVSCAIVPRKESATKAIDACATLFGAEFGAFKRTRDDAVAARRAGAGRKAADTSAGKIKSFLGPPPLRRTK